MFNSIRFRFIGVSVLIVSFIAVLAITQYKFSSTIEHLREAQLVLKELEIKMLEMHYAQSKYIVTREDNFADDVEVYSNTMDVYLSIIDENLDEFTYTKLNFRTINQQ